MKVVRVLSRLPVIGSEIEYPFLVVDADDVLAMERAAGDPVLQFSICIIQIKMSPAVPFAPFNELLSLVYQTETPDLHIGVQPFMDQRPGHRIPYGYSANIDAFKIAARTGNIEFRIGAQPVLG